MPALRRNRITIAGATVSLAFIIALALYPRPHKKLEVEPGCKTPEVVSCLQDYAYEQMQPRDIWRLAAEGLPKCLSDDPEALHKQTTCLPVYMGITKTEDGRAPVAVSRPSRFPAVSFFDSVFSPAAFYCCKMGGYPLLAPGSGGASRACLTPEFVALYGERLEVDKDVCGTWWQRLTMPEEPPFQGTL